MFYKTNNKPEWMSDTLFRCECHGDHFFEVFFDEDCPESIWINFIDDDLSLWQVLVNWWRQKRFWHAECMLSKEDALQLRNKLNEYLGE